MKSSRWFQWIYVGVGERRILGVLVYFWSPFQFMHCHWNDFRIFTGNLPHSWRQSTRLRLPRDTLGLSKLDWHKQMTCFPSRGIHSCTTEASSFPVWPLLIFSCAEVPSLLSPRCQKQWQSWPLTQPVLELSGLQESSQQDREKSSVRSLWFVSERKSERFRQLRNWGAETRSWWLMPTEGQFQQIVLIGGQFAAN